MTSIIAPVCVDCRHFNPSDAGLNCRAFRGPVPDIVLYDGHDHRTPLAGDHGIRFEPVAGRAPIIATRAVQ